MLRIVLIFLLLAGPAYSAAVCVDETNLNCQNMGYTESSCGEAGGVACPFDISLWRCAKWTCADGRLQDAEIEGANCEPFTYKGLECYLCDTCGEGLLDYDACWEGQMATLLMSPTQCQGWGYTDTAGSCSDYLVCPSDSTKIRCLDDDTE